MKRFLLLLLVVAAPFISAQTPKSHTYSLPNHKGGLVLDFGDFHLRGGDITPDGKQVHFEAIGPNGVFFLTAFVQEPSKPGDAHVCRDTWFSGTKKGMDDHGMHYRDLKYYDLPNTAVVEYTVPMYQGQKVDQHSVHAYLAGGDVWVEIHMSKVGYTDADHAVFEKVLNSARVDPDYVPDSHDYFVYGSLAYRHQGYQVASKWYQQSLDMEKADPKLDATTWRVLVDNLGMAYGMSGDLSHAKQTFEYGLSKDPQYPMFHYNMACTYAEMKDRDGAIAELKVAYQYKANVIQGEHMPDPRTDDSFQRYMNDAKFLEALQTLDLPQK
jgi:hypothetical protein